MQTGKVTPVIDRTYPLSQVPEAMRYLEEGHARGKVVITLWAITSNTLAPSQPAAGSASTSGPVVIAFGLIGIPLAVLIVPIIAAFALNRRFKRRNPDKRGYRWGYYFSIMSFIAGVCLGILLESGAMSVIVCGVIYAVLAWFFAQRHHWAWITLTIFSFNPVAWIINVHLPFGSAGRGKRALSGCGRSFRTASAIVALST